jgi:mRNA-degrading endonuclease toxin of MazEF toxin-antitoxin module
MSDKESNNSLVMPAASNPAENADVPIKDNQKHKKVVTGPMSEKALVATMSNLAKVILTLDHKQQHIISEWMTTWGQYLAFEKSFEPQRLIYYKRGDVVLAHLGYNVGSEQGGIRYAVVVENKNNKTDGVVVVVPISSLEDGRAIEDLHRTEVFLGKLIDGVDCYAKPLQIRPISKLRIIKPKYKEHKKTVVSGGLLDKIDEQIKLSFTKQEAQNQETAT